MKIYKIRRKSDGLFATGGSMFKFTPLGKIWHRLEDVVRHIEMLSEYENNVKENFEEKGLGHLLEGNDYVRSLRQYKEGCEVIVYETKECERMEVSIKLKEYLQGEKNERQQNIKSGHKG
jgi:hypothetical protein